MNKKLAETIIEMAEIDQAARFAAVKAKAEGLKPENLLIYTIDSLHNYRVKELIKRHGYPRLRTVGKEALRSFWLLIQHQDHDLDLQKECLKRCDFEPEERALLTDRILLAEGKPQKYGTQNNAPIKDLLKTNRERKKIGLPSLKEPQQHKNTRK